MLHQLTDVETENVIVADKTRGLSWNALEIKPRYVHVISVSLANQLEYLTEAERIGLIIDLFRGKLG